MDLGRRAVVSVVGLLALFATGVFSALALIPDPGVARAARFVGLAQPPVAFLAGARAAQAEIALPAPPPAPETAAEAPLVFDHPGRSLVADAAVASVQIFDSPQAAGPGRILANPTIEGMPLVFLVKQNRGEWLKVQLPLRPNESTGWVRAADVSLRSVSNHIIVEVAKRKLSLFSGSQLLMQAPVGVGKAHTPTPPGSFYVDISVKNPGGPYGRHMLSVAGFSNVLKNFGRGVGQLAIHGTNSPPSVGQFSSNGCMRLHNEDVVRLAGLAPTGTPVFILP
jgi:lipoprotein-anchoring transpeptidase ErfK/SrfK